MRRILWRHRCAELYRAFINDPAQSGLNLEDSHYLRHERLEERIVLSAPTIDQVQNIDNLELNQTGVYTVELTGIDNGLTGDDTLTISATSSDLTVATNPLVVHVPGETTASLSFDTLGLRGTSTITVTLDNGVDAATTMMFDVTVDLAIDDSDATTEDSTTSGNLLTNDQALLGETLSVSSITVGMTTFPVDQTGLDTQIEVAGMGLLTVNMDGSYAFDPQDDFQSLSAGSMTTISFDYEVVATDALDMVTAMETGTLSIEITGANDAPSIDLDADDSSGATGNDYQTTYIAGASAIAAVDTDLNITDTDSGQEFASATITLTKSGGGDLDSGELIAVSAQAGLTVTTDTSMTDEYVLTITSSTPGGTITESNLETILTSLTYVNTSNGTSGIRTITVVINDGMANSAVATSTITVLKQTDVSVSVTDSPDPVIPGGTVTYTVTFTNEGFDEVTSLQVNLGIDSDLTSVMYVASDGSFNSTTGDLTGLTLATGQMVTLTITGVVDTGIMIDPDNPELSFTAALTEVNGDTTPDDDLTNNAPPAETTEVRLQNDVAVSIADSADPVAQGNSLSYTVTFTNEGIDVVNSLVVALTLPPIANFNSVSFTPNQGSFNSNTGALSGLNLSSGESVTLTIAGTVASQNSLTVTAALTQVNGSSTPDDDLSNNTATETTTVLLQTDVSVSITELTADPIAPGGTVMYEVTFTNEGVDDINRLDLALTLPAGLTLTIPAGNYPVSYVNQDGMTVTGQYDYGTDFATGRIRFATGDVLTTGHSVILLITGTVATDITIDLNNPELTFTARLTRVNSDSSPPIDNKVTNNSDTETTDVKFPVDVSVQVSDSADPVIAGTQMTYSILVTNEGGTDVTGLVVNVPIPSGTSYVSDNSAALGDTFNQTSGAWTIGDLASGASVTLELIVTVAPDVSSSGNPDLSLTASIDTYDQFAMDGNGGDDSGAGNNFDVEETEVDRLVDIEVVSITGPSAASNGDTVTYTIVVQNNGPSEATDVRIGVPQPAGTVNQSDDGSPGWNDGSNYFLISALAPGEANKVTLTYSVRIDPNSNNTPAGFIIVTATLDTAALDQPDTVPTNNSKSFITSVSSQVDLQLTVDAPTEVVAGQDINYTLTVDNLGPTDTTGVVVVIDVPTNGTIDPAITMNAGVSQKLEYNDVTMMDEWMGRYEWVIGALNADATPPMISFTIHTAATNPNEYDVTVSAAVTGDDSALDPNSDNDSISAITSVKNDPPTFTERIIPLEEGNDFGASTLPQTQGNQVSLSLFDNVTDDQITAGVISQSDLIAHNLIEITATWRNSSQVVILPVSNQLTVLSGTPAQATFALSADGKTLNYYFSNGIDGLTQDEVVSYKIRYVAYDPANQFVIAESTITITGENDTPMVITSTIVETLEAVQVLVRIPFTDADLNLDANGNRSLEVHNIEILSVTGPDGPLDPADYELVLDNEGNVPVQYGSIQVNGVTKDSYYFDLLLTFPDDDPTGTSSDTVTVMFKVTDEGPVSEEPVEPDEVMITVYNQNPSITNYESDVQLSNLGEIVIPITLGDPGLLDTLTIEVDRVATKDPNTGIYIDDFEEATGGDVTFVPDDPGDPRTGKLTIKYIPDDFDGLTFSLRIRVKDDDMGLSTVVIADATVPAGIGLLIVTPEEEEAAAPLQPLFDPPPATQSTNTLNFTENIQRALTPPVKGETVALQLRIVWNYGDPDSEPWEETIREFLAKDRKELQEKLKELSELLRGLPDNQYRAILVRGDGTENLLMEVRIRGGEIVELKQQEIDSAARDTSNVSTEEKSPETIPGDPMSRLERALGPLNPETTDGLGRSTVDPFVRFGRDTRVEAWQSVYRARTAMTIEN